jgi:transcription antitermination factor NusA-like protein
MVKTIDMQDIRHINLFSKISRVNPRFCFSYNQTIIFCVPKRLLQKAIGLNGKNLKKFYQILGRKIKVLPLPNGIKDAEEFIKKIIFPITFRNIDIKEDKIIINAGKTNRASLIGREKKRFLELQKILRDFFNKDLKII